ncbi:pyridoxal phosphate-dependent enzyme, D-cysteine desulfhydrase family protein [Nitzschia inconspicua]|uniref:Pyridoxal phosphate-dependent enzyme, D-cysteine desulfhydrase family protein n=1 Tax=Nitzschia inconspicua TaxID=303405 RepID=A0A9K3KMV8_9STRA|nr:pyridoxal phosphate-dependent enzyme, D-cysteine desulfhydrase family protein [Nitzschia inconspicua]
MALWKPSRKIRNSNLSFFQSVAAITILLFMMSSSTTRGYSSCQRHGLKKSVNYKLPTWAEDSFAYPPKHGRLQLGNFPTPMYRLHPTPQSRTMGEKSIMKRFEDLDIAFYVKRDDMSGGCETGGNKIRKLEFLLADAVATDHQSVVTIGGEQSNHCRATAAACRMLGLKPHLILRTSRTSDIQENKDDIGFVGNILFDRMLGSTIYTCTPGEYGRVGSVALVDCLAKYLEDKDPLMQGSPYRIPVGGSNGLGTFGYLNAVDEILEQWWSEDGDETDSDDPTIPLNHVVFACGSGGTACGLALGMALAHGAFGKSHRHTQLQGSTPPTVHAVGVCDNPDYFYSSVARIADEMGLKLPAEGGFTTEAFVRQHMFAHSGKGLGYAQSTDDELEFVSNFALETGIVLDPVYSGKAMYHFVNEILDKDPERFRGTSILFVHTGGSLGLYDKGDDLMPILQRISHSRRLDIYGKDLSNAAVDLSIFLP